VILICSEDVSAYRPPSGPETSVDMVLKKTKADRDLCLLRSPFNCPQSFTKEVRKTKSSEGIDKIRRTFERENGSRRIKVRPDIRAGNFAGRLEFPSRCRPVYMTSVLARIERRIIQKGKSFGQVEFRGRFFELSQAFRGHGYTCAARRPRMLVAAVETLGCKPP